MIQVAEQRRLAQVARTQLFKVSSAVYIAWAKLSASSLLAKLRP